MAKIKPVAFVWNGREMVPLPRYRQLCDQQFLVGEEYPLAMLDARSRKSHSHYFACVHEAWHNLPEDIKGRFPNEEYLRKTALVKTGYCIEKNFVCDTPSHAIYLAGAIRKVDGYAVITIKENVVHVYEAESQNANAMGAERFQQSKEAVFGWISELIGVSVTDLKRAGSRHFRPEPRKKNR